MGDLIVWGLFAAYWLVGAGRLAAAAAMDHTLPRMLAEAILWAPLSLYRWGRHTLPNPF